MLAGLFLQRFQRKSYPSKNSNTIVDIGADMAEFNRAANAMIDALTPPAAREGLARHEKQRREKQARKDAARDALRNGHAALVKKLLAELSALERAREAGSVTATMHRMRVDTAHVVHDQRVRQMLQTAERVYGATAVSSAKQDLDL